MADFISAEWCAQCTAERLLSATETLVETDGFENRVRAQMASDMLTRLEIIIADIPTCRSHGTCCGRMKLLSERIVRLRSRFDEKTRQYRRRAPAMDAVGS